MKKQKKTRRFTTRGAGNMAIHTSEDDRDLLKRLLKRLLHKERSAAASELLDRIESQERYEVINESRMSRELPCPEHGDTPCSCTV